MTLIALVSVGDAIVCMADSRTSDDTGSQTSSTAIKSIVHHSHTASGAVSAIVTVAGRAYFTPGDDAANDPEPAIDVVAGALDAASAQGLRSVRDVGEAIWPTIKNRMLSDCRSCREVNEGEPDDSEVDCDAGHGITLELAGFEHSVDGPVAMRYRRWWTRPDKIQFLPMLPNSVYLSAQQFHLQLNESNLPRIKDDASRPIESGGTVIRDLRKRFKEGVRDFRLKEEVGGMIRTTVLYPDGSVSAGEMDWEYDAHASTAE
ncbi:MULTISPECIES: hypothetical protein [unclassified Rhodococcus (in: high G+C Gram-positive bacteria)]|uniref:hypothetical protein n=1 Tax=unclassified Rhodococcus (in: high G+C Gram-positive bacteria) TaxID=192944 RepID=UPI0006FBA693|nr:MULTISPECIES: hypothetical protein [unclassified Rhodococcus (in: high G+C Gram-positive bacteria)]KQU28418.1 hypothetical protein ASG69_10415 [Rhodococcus sp. Leaf225]KQU46524.1 hypothetical protein ASH03_07445 [Rhodococcus sp. Leaf258]